MPNYTCARTATIDKVIAFQKKYGNKGVTGGNAQSPWEMYRARSLAEVLLRQSNSYISQSDTVGTPP